MKPKSHTVAAVFTYSANVELGCGSVVCAGCSPLEPRTSQRLLLHAAPVDFLLALQLFDSVLHALNVQLELMLYTNMLSDIGF